MERNTVELMAHTTIIVDEKTAINPGVLKGISEITTKNI
jgi:hypothetical protein